MSVDDTADFSKQRRNLIIISGVLILHDFLGINYEDFKVFGMQITKGENISWVIWIMWLYFFVRYLNLFSEKRNMFQYKLKDIYETKLINKYKYIFFKEFKISSCDKQTTTGSYIFPKLNLYHHKNIRRNNEPGNFDKSYKTNWKDFIYYFPKSLKEYLLNTHYFFEYYFPILFGLLPLIIFFYKNLSVFAPLW